jgi:hypothetical protein
MKPMNLLNPSSLMTMAVNPLLSTVLMMKWAWTMTIPVRAPDVGRSESGQHHSHQK